jgi:chromosome partitioning protein
MARSNEQGQPQPITRVLPAMCNTNHRNHTPFFWRTSLTSPLPIYESDLEDDPEDTSDASVDILGSIRNLREWGRENLGGRVLTFTGDKGGVGKTRNAIEFSYILDALYCDMDWNNGNGSRALNWRHEDHMTSPMLSGMTSGKMPRPISGARYGRPDMIACGEDFELGQPPQARITDIAVQWAKESGRCLVFDTHPGTGSAAYGAIAASHLVVVVVKFENESLEALEGFAEKMRGHELAVLLNEVKTPTDRHMRLLEQIVTTYELPVLPIIPFEKSLKERAARTAAMSAKKVAKSKAEWMGAMVQMTTEVGGRVA